MEMIAEGMPDHAAPPGRADGLIDVQTEQFCAERSASSTDSIPPLVALGRRAPPRRGHRRRGRHVLHLGVLGDGVAADAEPSGYLGPRHAVGVHRAYIISNVPRARSSPPSFPGGLAKVAARENDTARAAPPVPRGAALLINLLNSS